MTAGRAAGPRARVALLAAAMALSAAAVGGCIREWTGMTITDHPCWKMEDILVRITPDMFEDLGVPRTFWVAGPAPRCSFQFGLRPQLGFEDDAACLMSLEPRLEPPPWSTYTYEVSVSTRLLGPDCHALAYLGTQRTGGERPDGSYLVGDPPSWDAGAPVGQPQEADR